MAARYRAPSQVQEGRLMAISVEFRSIRTAMAASQHPAMPPKWRAFQVVIPEGWMALLPVLYPIPHGPREQTQPDMPAALSEELLHFAAGILLCRQGTDCRVARQEFEAGTLLAASFLGQDGRYLQDARERPAYAVTPLEGPKSHRGDLSRSVECLVLLPLYVFPREGAAESPPPIMMFVDGICVHRSDRSTPVPQTKEASEC